jgi:hypothetical protein
MNKPLQAFRRASASFETYMFSGAIRVAIYGCFFSLEIDGYGEKSSL